MLAPSRPIIIRALRAKIAGGSRSTASKWVMQPQFRQWWKASS